MSSVALPSTRRFRTAAAALSAVAVLAGCGSTVQVSSTGAAAGLGTTADGTGVAPGTVVDPATGAVVPSTTGGSLPGTTGSTATPGTAGTATVGGSTTVRPGTAGGSAATPGAVAASALPAKGFGWDEKNVYFGVVTQNDAQQAFASVGADGVDPGDTLGQANAVAAYVNSHGGILGRTLKIIAKDVQTIDTATRPEPVGSEVCTYFTEDNKVVGVLSVVTVMDYPNFRACLAKRKVTLWSSTLKVADDASSADLAPYFVQTVMTSWTKLAPVFVSRLKAQNYFSGWDVRTGAPGSAKTRVGVVVDSTTAGTRIGKLLQSELAKAGYADTVVFQYGAASDGQSKTVTNFQQNGVTHVIVTDVELTAFQVAAGNQAYKPRYGISSYNAPYSNLEADGLTPADANNGAVGVGFAPALDVSEANDPGTSPGLKACRAIMQAGQQQLSGKRLAQAVAWSLCDALLLTQQAANAGGAFSGGPLDAGLAKVGPSFPTATGFSSAVGSRGRFVPGSVRDLAWNPSCSCMRYASAVTRL